jgi:hypothetical protein
VAYYDEGQKIIFGGQCFGSGSGWIRIQFGPGSGIRIPDPDAYKKVEKAQIYYEWREQKNAPIVFEEWR